MSQAAYDEVQKALTAKRAAEQRALVGRLVAQATVVVLNARLVPAPSGPTTDAYLVPVDDIEELRKLLTELGVDTTTEEGAK